MRERDAFGPHEGIPRDRGGRARVDPKERHAGDDTGGGFAPPRPPRQNEDLCTSYGPPFGGDPKDLDDERRSVGFLKGLVDGLNHPYIPGRPPAPFDESVVAVHFHPMIAFVEKGTNRPAVPAYLRAEIERARTECGDR